MLNYSESLDNLMAGALKGHFCYIQVNGSIKPPMASTYASAPIPRLKSMPLNQSWPNVRPATLWLHFFNTFGSANKG